MCNSWSCKRRETTEKGNAHQALIVWTKQNSNHQILACIFQIHADTAKVQLDKKLYSLKWMWEFAPPNAKLCLGHINDNSKGRKRHTKRQQKYLKNFPSFKYVLLSAQRKIVKTQLGSSFVTFSFYTTIFQITLLFYRGGTEERLNSDRIRAHLAITSSP